VRAIARSAAGSSSSSPRSSSERRAEFDVLVVISACPDDQDGVNDSRPRPLGIKIIAPE
jgi:uncharacterized protein YcgI (DUF1989 family)